MTSTSSGWYGTTESMQKLQVYGHPRLPSMGTIFNSGALRSVRAMNFQRCCTPGSSRGCCFAARTTPSGRWTEQSRSTSRITFRSVKPRT